MKKYVHSGMRTSLTSIKLVIFDRDGTLNYDRGYTHKPEDLKWLPGALRTLKFLEEHSILAAVATNQSGIARGFFSQAAVDKFHSQMAQEAIEHFGRIDRFYTCPHAPALTGQSNCNCRKPNPGMLLTALSDYNLTVRDALFVGNSTTDQLAANAADIDFWMIKKPASDYGKLREKLSC